jgi:hypothetical protein
MMVEMFKNVLILKMPAMTIGIAAIYQEWFGNKVLRESIAVLACTLAKALHK